MSTTIATLSSFVEHGYHLTIYCEDCRHPHTPDKRVLVEKFGADFDVIERRAEFLSRFKCSVCGSKNLTLRIGSDHSGTSAMARGEG